MNARHQRTHERDPLGPDFPAVSAAEIVNNRNKDLIALGWIAENAVIRSTLDGLDDRRRRGEIHVRDPAWDDVAVGIFVPLSAIRPRAFRTAIKIESHSLGRTLD